MKREKRICLEKRKGEGKERRKEKCEKVELRNLRYSAFVGMQRLSFQIAIGPDADFSKFMSMRNSVRKYTRTI